MPGFDKEQISEFECHELIEYLSEEHQVDPRILKYIVSCELIGAEFADARFCDATEQEMKQVGITPAAISHLREVHRSVVVSEKEEEEEEEQIIELEEEQD